MLESIQSISVFSQRHVDVCLKHGVVSVEVMNKVESPVVIKGTFTGERGKDKFWCHP